MDAFGDLCGSLNPKIKTHKPGGDNGSACGKKGSANS
jgi:hypothetical protein